MFVAFHHPHNEGVEAGIITGPGYDTKTRLTDTYEVDATIKSFETEDEARAWLESMMVDLGDLIPVTGGYAYTGDEDDDED